MRAGAIRTLINDRSCTETRGQHFHRMPKNWVRKTTNSASNYMFKVNNRNTRTRCEICSKLTIKTPE